MNAVRYERRKLSELIPDEDNFRTDPCLDQVRQRFQSALCFEESLALSLLIELRRLRNQRLRLSRCFQRIATLAIGFVRLAPREQRENRGTHCQ
jgi:hypothetical protein